VALPGHQDDVLGHGDGLTSLNANNSKIALSRTLLASGEFVAMTEGTTTLGFGPGVEANVMWYDGKYKAIAATTVLASGGAQVTVVPEPCTATLFAIGLAGLLVVRRVRRRRCGTV
jgi:hypothetical protein